MPGPVCAHENTPGARFCERGGARLAPALPSCGEDIGVRSRFCPACGATLAEPAAERAAALPQAAPDVAGPPGERRQLTVLFSDLVDSTALAHRLDPEDCTCQANRTT